MSKRNLSPFSLHVFLAHVNPRYPKVITGDQKMILIMGLTRTQLLRNRSILEKATPGIMTGIVEFQASWWEDRREQQDMPEALE